MTSPVYFKPKWREQALKLSKSLNGTTDVNGAILSLEEMIANAEDAIAVMEEMINQLKGE